MATRRVGMDPRIRPVDHAHRIHQHARRRGTRRAPNASRPTSSNTGACRSCLKHSTAYSTTSGAARHPSHVYDALAAARRSRRRRLRWRWNRHDLPRIQGHRNVIAQAADSDGGWTVGALVQANYGRRKNCASVDIPSARCSATSRLHSGNATSASQHGRSWLRSRRTRFVATSRADCAPCRRRTRPGRRRHRIRERRHFRCFRSAIVACPLPITDGLAHHYRRFRV